MTLFPVGANYVRTLDTFTVLLLFAHSCIWSCTQHQLSVLHTWSLIILVSWRFNSYLPSSIYKSPFIIISTWSNQLRCGNLLIIMMMCFPRFPSRHPARPIRRDQTWLCWENQQLQRASGKGIIYQFYPNKLSTRHKLLLHKYLPK